MESPTVRVPDSPEGIYERFLDEGWGDGLPLVPPTQDRVEAALRFTDYDPEHIAAVIPPAQGEASVLKIAVNCVMAGCHPSYLPVLIQAVIAMSRPQLNVYGIQATTNPATVAGFVNGPVIDQLGFNAGCNCLGQGNRANATVGRAIRLVLINIGGGRPGLMDRATHGQPGKYTFFFAENEPDSPWTPYHVDAGFDPKVSTVTVFSASGTMNLLESTEDDEEMLSAFAGAIRSPVSNDYMFNGEPWLIFSPEHAATLHRSGYDKDAVRRGLWEMGKMPLREFSRRVVQYRVRPTWEPILGQLDDDTLIPLGETPDHIRIMVAGGPGTHSVYVQGFGATQSVTMAITDSKGVPISRFGVAAPVR